ncbi:hypothetical protein CBS101457_004738 [Exobasidium rhododendri]|nr:hypothetical protein CBS101457_004738 [Exobasidium rhododendri]
MLLTQCALGQALVPLPYIARTFGLENQPNQQSWFISSFSLTVGTFVLPSGRLGDMYGHRLIMQIGFAWFAVWQMVSGLVGQYTTSYIGYDITRALVGIGPALLLPNAVAILARLYPPGTLKKYIAFSAFAATGPQGCVVGAVFATLLADNPNLGWPWSCYIFAIVLLLAFIATFFVVPSDGEIAEIVKRDQGAPPEDARQTFDIWGTLTGVPGLVLFNFAWNQAIVVGWPTVYVYVLLIVALLFLVAFVIVEGRVQSPLVPLKVFTVQTSLILACISFGWSSFGIFLFYTVRFIQELRHHSVLSSAAQIAPCAIAGTIAAFTSAYLLSSLRPALVMLIAMCCFCAGNALIAFQPIDQTFWIQTFIAALITPFGMDMSFPSGCIIVSDALPPHQQGLAGSLVNTIVNYSIALGLGLAGTLEMQVNRNGTDVERGYRGALWLGMGLAGLGVICALVSLLLDVHQDGRQKASERAEKSPLSDREKSI